MNPNAQSITMALRRLSERHHNAVVATLAIVATIVWTILGGKDLNWDQVNYHFYLPHSLFQNKLATDFIPTNGQSYLNPWAYAPFYLMVMAGWRSVIIASALAIMHAANIILAFQIGKAVLPKEHPHSLALAALGALFAFLSPVFLMESGTTFADITTASLVLGAILMGLQPNHSRPWWREPALIAGVLLGAAGALKLSNLVFGPACALLFATRQPSFLKMLRALTLLAIGSTLGMLFVQGYWGWLLWKQFGNPFLPFFGGLFPTDVFPESDAALERFLLDSPWDALLLPFRMLQLRAWIYIENVAPDLRFAALLLIAAVGGLYAFARRLRNKTLAHPRPTNEFIALILCFIAAYGLWLWTSGNGRYGLVVSLLCGPVLATTVYYIARNKPAATYLLMLLAIAQTIHLSNGDLLWARGSWTKTWYEVSVPERLRHEDYLYVAVSGNSNSFVYPFLSPGSAFTNPIGQISFDFDQNGGKRLRTLLDKHRGHIRVISIAPHAELTDATLDIWLPGVDALISRLGYGVDRRDCEMITAAGSTTILGRDFTAGDETLKRLITCKVYERPFELAAERQRITRIAKQVVQWCPKLFKPSYTVVERSPHSWSISYPATDAVLIVKDDVLIGSFTRSAATLMFGTLEQWERGYRPSCEDLARQPRKTYTFD